MAPIFTSRINTGTHKFDDSFFEIISLNFTSCCLKVRNQYIEQLPLGTSMRCWCWLLGARRELINPSKSQFFRRIFFYKDNVCCFHDRNPCFHNKSWTPLHFASLNDQASTCQLLCALDGVDQNAVDINGETALDLAIRRSKVDCVRALLEFNVDTSKARVTADTNVEIVQLLDEHRKRSVKENNILFVWKEF